MEQTGKEDCCMTQNVSDEDIIFEYIEEERWHINEFLCFLSDYRLKNDILIQVVQNMLDAFGIDKVEPVDVLDVIDEYRNNLSLDTFYSADDLFENMAGLFYSIKAGERWSFLENEDFSFSDAKELSLKFLPRLVAHIMTLEQLDDQYVLNTTKEQLRNKRQELDDSKLDVDNTEANGAGMTIKSIMKFLKENFFIIFFILLCIAGMIPTAISLGWSRFILSLIMCAIGIYIYYLIKAE